MLAVGQKVFVKKACDACTEIILRHRKERPEGVPILEDDIVYTVRTSEPHPLTCGRIRLQEVTLPVINGAEVAYVACGFRPVSEKYIEEFNKLTQPYDPEKDPDEIKKKETEKA